jgi:hypothetical protein
VLASASDASNAMAAITAAVARGELTPAEAADLSNIVRSYAAVIEASEFEARLRAIEAKVIL